GIAAFIFTVNNPLEGNPTTTVIGDTGEEVKITLGIIDNTNLDRTTEGVGTDVGEAAPNFILADGDGNPVHLDSFLGEKAVVVNFWASWCPFCLEEMPDLERTFQEFNDDLVIIGINNMETPGQGASYATERGVTYPIVYFPNDPEVISAYEVLSMPTTYYLNKDGIIVERKIGFDTFEGMSEKALKAIGDS
ncbi:MAG: TlpA family protein disulfide reductase, partial [Dehalococcoidia bacterium]